MGEEKAVSARVEDLRHLPAQTLDGVSIPLHANLGIGDEDFSTLAQEYEGAGLYRTEFFFIARETLPTEDEQYRLYRDLLESFAPKPVTIRTLDTGGDKKLPFFTIAEANPFLDRARMDLAAKGLAVPRPDIGAMIEVPSAVYLIAELSKRVDFFPSERTILPSIENRERIRYASAVESRLEFRRARRARARKLTFEKRKCDLPNRYGSKAADRCE